MVGLNSGSKIIPGLLGPETRRMSINRHAKFFGKSYFFFYTGITKNNPRPIHHLGEILAGSVGK